MIRVAFLSILIFVAGCTQKQGKVPLVVKTELPKELKEISGITAAGSDIWAITDKPRAQVFKLDTTGKLVQTVEVTNVEAVDVEAVAADNANLYIGDVGDNNGDRIERKIIKIPFTAIKPDPETEVTGDTITFVFPGQSDIEKKKENNYDCESLISFKDSLYVFTKDRQDKQTKLFALPKTPGNYTARFIDSFNCNGLITDAAVNKANNELALIGYHKGHQFPFIFLFDNFHGDDFLSGSHKKIELADKPWDWQLEGITYSDKNVVYFSCEGTKQVHATFYGIKRTDIFSLKKKKPKEDDEDKYPGLTKKGHLKM
jgi:hypothetical protein